MIAKEISSYIRGELDEKIILQTQKKNKEKKNMKAPFNFTITQP